MPRVDHRHHFQQNGGGELTLWQRNVGAVKRGQDRGVNPGIGNSSL